jgi:hypothetical protein
VSAYEFVYVYVVSVEIGGTDAFVGLRLCVNIAMEKPRRWHIKGRLNCGIYTIHGSSKQGKKRL